MKEATVQNRERVDSGMKKTDVARAQVLELSRGMRSRMMASAREMIKQSVVDDPDIWRCARSITEAAVEQFLLDLEHEVERALETAVLQPRNDSDACGPEGDTRMQRLWVRVRALVLHHYLPFNRSIYGKFKDPLYLLMYGLTLMPIHGVRVAFFSVVLSMLAWPRPADEHQLINFILIFKGMQFLTSGVLFMAKGAMQYFSCYSFNKEHLLGCIEVAGPGAAAGIGQMVDYLGSVILVWIAFSYLPKSKRYSQVQTGALKKPLVSNQEERSTYRLRRLLYYDVVCFSLSLVVLVTLTVCTCRDTLSGGLPTLATFRDGQFHANVYWCIVLYSMLSLPFSLFTVPGLQKVLTHSEPTGYNAHGACVAFALPTQDQVAAADSQPKPSSLGMADVAARMTASLLRTTAKGRTARGGEEHGEYKTWDFARGVLANVHGGWGNAAPGTGPSDNAPPGDPEHHGGEAAEKTGWGKFKAAMMLMKRDKSSPRHASTQGLPVASVRIVPGATEQIEGVAFFRVEGIQDCSLDGAFGEPWQVLRQHKDFSALSRRLTALVEQDGSSAMPPELPEDASRGRSWIELEAQRRELEAWLESIVHDMKSQSIWAHELSDFLGIIDCGEYKMPVQAQLTSSNNPAEVAHEIESSSSIAEVEDKPFWSMLNVFKDKPTGSEGEKSHARGAKRSYVKEKMAEAFGNMQNFRERLDPSAEHAPAGGLDAEDVTGFAGDSSGQHGGAANALAREQEVPHPPPVGVQVQASASQSFAQLSPTNPFANPVQTNPFALAPARVGEAVADSSSSLTSRPRLREASALGSFGAAAASSVSGAPQGWAVPGPSQRGLAAWPSRAGVTDGGAAWQADDRHSSLGASSQAVAVHGAMPTASGSSGISNATARGSGANAAVAAAPPEARLEAGFAEKRFSSDAAFGPPRPLAVSAVSSEGSSHLAWMRGAASAALRTPNSGEAREALHGAAADKGRRALAKLEDTSGRVRSKLEHLREKALNPRSGHL